MQASTEPAPTVAQDLHLSPAEVLTLQNAVRELDNFMVKSVNDKRRNLWVRPETKDVVDHQVRALLRDVAHTFQTKPTNDTTRRARTSLLTRRVRVVLRAFSEHPSYTTAMPPGIAWDEAFIPRALYPEPVPEAPAEVEEGLGAAKGEPVSVDKGKGKERAAGERVSVPVIGEGKMGKVATTGKGKGKARELATTSTTTSTTKTVDPVLPSAAATRIRPSKKRKVTSAKIVEDSDEQETKKRKVSSPKTEKDSDYEDASPAPAPGRRLPSIKASLRRNKGVTIPLSSLLPPPPCRRCVRRKLTCVPTGWKSACEGCSDARQGCSHVKANPPREAIPSGTLPVAGSSNRQSVKIIIPKAMQAKGSGPSKAVIVSVPSVVAPSNQEGGASSAAPSLLPVSAAPSRRVTPAGPAEAQIPTNTTAPPNADLNALRERILDLEHQVRQQGGQLREQDRRMREVEASDVALQGVMVTQDQLKNQDKDIRSTLKASEKALWDTLVTQEELEHKEKEILSAFNVITGELHHKSRRIERKVNACTEGEVKDLMTRLVTLSEGLAQMGETLDGQDHIMRDELQAAERRWERHVNEQEQRVEGLVEGMIEETQIRLESKQREKADMLSARVDEAILKITEDNLKAPWQRQIQEASLSWQKELEVAVATTREEFSDYTPMSTTEKIVQQLATLQIHSHDQFHSLQGGLTTMERLYLRQLGSTADLPVVDARQKLREVLKSQPVQHVPRVALASNSGPLGRIVKGLPRQARATSGPPASPSRPQPPRIVVSPEEHQSDVEMKDGAVDQAEPGEVAEDEVELPSLKRARSNSPTSLVPVNAFIPRRTRSQSRAGFLPQVPVLQPPPAIPESALAPPESSPLTCSEPDEVPGMCLADIFQEHVLDA